MEASLPTNSCQAPESGSALPSHAVIMLAQSTHANIITVYASPLHQRESMVYIRSTRNISNCTHRAACGGLVNFSISY